MCTNSRTSYGVYISHLVFFSLTNWCSAIVLSMYMLSFFFLIVFFFLWKKICLGFVLYFIIHIVIRNPIIKRGGWIPWTLLTPPHVCACPKSRPAFSLAYVGQFFYIGQSETRISYGNHARFLSNQNEMRNFSRWPS